MSTIEKPSTPKPRKPWAATPVDRTKTAGIVLAAIAIAFVIVAVTPLSGKLAYAVMFGLSYLVIDFVASYIKAGRPAAVDSLFRGLVTSAIAIAVTPIISILFTVWIRGHKGLHWTLFTKDMHNNAFTDPVSQGGLLHAIIGTFLLVVVALLISVPIGILSAYKSGKWI